MTEDWKQGTNNKVPSMP